MFKILLGKFQQRCKFFRILEICKPLAALELIETDKLSRLFVPCKFNIIGGERSSISRIILLDEVSVNFIPKQYGIFNKFQEESALLALHDEDLLYENKRENNNQ